ncbi:2-oxoglutarate dehydrogenase, E2 component, dihydrolipoamide succinyltransferase [Brevibacterium spongiae]|uniref:Dihydrolipoamide acetyltransferase component of pyruvate dehydrogenase complex n=1 Tax=Brevibacterium spongiae TaxID=2909672 RepID=A0ABY5SUG5_9MICO|nr:2-oxoglutarate dehydrogenase, E2 component, dihydrolipoamide succinyltransferase [Brevibacterium spongiae]UVI37790.1 2-oxoglutarate dehydrogenase, E2 component, dihydrolipoamide succinyltransferase [Brevibacterium spongiae]
MSNSVQMPALGESVTEGTVTRWLKSVGDEVEVDEPLLEVSTDKVDTEIPSPYAGTLEKILADEDDVVEVGGDLAYIGDGSGSSDDDSAPEAEEASSDDEPAEEASGEDSAPAEESAPAAEETAPQEEAEESAPAASSSGSADSGEGTEITMPALGESVTEGTVTRWLKEVGEEVEVDEPLLEVSTDKVDTEVPSPVAGTVQAHLAEEDETVEVGAPLARVGTGAPAKDDAPADEAPKDEAPAKEEAPAEEAPKQEEPAQEAPKQEAPKQEAPKEEAAPKPAQTSSAQAASAAQAEEPVEAAAQAPAAADTVGENAAYVTPLVRRLAREKGVDLSQVTGTGVGGRIRKQDVETAAKNGPAAAPAAAAAPSGAPKAPFKVEIPEEVAKLRGTTEKASRIRQTIAKRMSESLDVSAQLTQVIEVDMSQVVKLRKANKEAFQSKHGSKLTYLPFFAKAIVEALQVHPKVNAQYDLESQQITYFDHEHLAVAVDTPRGLLVPVIKDAGDLSVAGLAKAIDDVADRTRNNKIMPDELSGGTFTVTNIGSVGALFDTPIINQPQMGILGTGAIVRRPIAVKTADGDESIAIRDMVYLPLTYNHQLVDGADAGRFLQTIKARLEEGNFEADLDL